MAGKLEEKKFKNWVWGALSIFLLIFVCFLREAEAFFLPFLFLISGRSPASPPETHPLTFQSVFFRFPRFFLFCDFPCFFARFCSLFQGFQELCREEKILAFSGGSSHFAKKARIGGQGLAGRVTNPVKVVLTSPCMAHWRKARLFRYLHLRGLADTSNSRVWSAEPCSSFLSLWGGRGISFFSFPCNEFLAFSRFSPSFQGRRKVG